MKINKETVKQIKIGNFTKFILTSAPFTLLLSIVFFWYEMNASTKEEEIVVDKLKKIEQSLSTRYIGIFPDYLPQINELLSETEAGDSIIIFEDVLYYGIFSAPQEFKQMINQLIYLANNGHSITIAHYNVNGRNPRQFREAVQESRISQQYLSKLAEERSIMLDDDSTRQNDLQDKGRQRFILADSIVSEKYFAQTRKDNLEKFKEKIENCLQPMYQEGDAMLFKRIDEIKKQALDKSSGKRHALDKDELKKITFNDFYEMYRNISNEIGKTFENHYSSRIKTIPLNNYLTMACWSNGKELLFALPGKFAADEIGFISHDDNIQKYIKTMLNGVKSQNNERLYTESQLPINAK
ncbi:MAG: hypothetical protein LBJ67_06590 [Planctomycetaceae bacterium]|jgi:hypothetical protein|nr:hypothetical protein [Planctomycetaceae bacterium]